MTDGWGKKGKRRGWNAKDIRELKSLAKKAPARQIAGKLGRTEGAVRQKGLLRGLTIAVGNRKNRILIYQFLAAEIRALHYSYGVGDGESYKRALTFLEECERLTLRSLVRKSAERHVEVTLDHAKRIFLRALAKLDGAPALVAELLYSEPGKRPDFEEVVNEAPQITAFP